MNILKFKKNSKGFTLLEILVVISIIGILIAVGATAYSTAQKKSRDARRQADMKQMQGAFEQYYATSGSSYADCSAMAGQFTGGQLPTDPKPGETYYCLGTPTTYCACAKLESGTGNSATQCNYTGTGYYCISNLQ